MRWAQLSLLKGAPWPIDERSNARRWALINSRIGDATLAQVMLFHHAQGLTSGVVAFADRLRRAEHGVHTPDFFDGRSLGITCLLPMLRTISPSNLQRQMLRLRGI